MEKEAYKSRTGSTRTASPGRINSDRLGSARIIEKPTVEGEKWKTVCFIHMKVNIPPQNMPNQDSLATPAKVLRDYDEYFIRDICPDE